MTAIKMKNTKLFFMRAFVGAIGMIAGFTCLTLIPLAQATAISFSQPLFITIGATLFLGEIIKARRIAAIIVGIIGMLIIVQGAMEQKSKQALKRAFLISFLAHSLGAL